MIVERDNTIDIAKGIGILLMVIGHFNVFLDYNSLPVVLIYGCHMPLFVFLSGSTLRYSVKRKYNSNYSLFFKDKFYSIIRPYVIVSLISMLLRFFMTGDINKEWITTLIKGEACNSDFSYNLPLWFFPMLFLCLSIFYVSLQLIKNTKIHGICSTLLSIVGFLLVVKTNCRIWNLDLALFLQVFVFIGYYYVDLKEKVKLLKTNKWVGLLILILVYILGCIQNGRVDLNARKINNVSLFLFIAFVGIAIILGISEIFASSRWISKILQLLGKNTMPILCWHIPLSNVFYSYIISMLPLYMQKIAWGGQRDGCGIVIAIVFNMTIVLPMSILLHRIVFKSA